MDRPTSTPSLAGGPRVSYAQCQEDILLDRLFAGQVGTFVDVGAHHPVFDSNTYFFYERGWRGVNVEPLPAFHQLLRERRPADLNLAVALSDAEGVLPFYEIPECWGLSTFSAEIAEQHRGHGLRVVERKVPVRSLGSLIAEYRIAAPDFLCVDVEGHELSVLRGIPMASWRPKVIVVEGTVPLAAAPNHAAWEPLLLGAGYLFAAFNGLNRFYLGEELRDRLDLLQVPVNVFDNYRTLEVVLLEARVRELEERLGCLAPGRME